MCAVLSNSSRILAWSVSTRGREDWWSPRDIAIPQGQGSADEWCGKSLVAKREKKKKKTKLVRKREAGWEMHAQLCSETWRIRRGEKGVGARKMARMD